MSKPLTLARSHKRWLVFLLAAGALIYIALLLASAETRKPWNDEAMAADAGYNLGYKGYTGVDFYEERAYGLIGASRHNYYMFPFQLCALAVWYHIAGFSLLSTRILSMLWTGGLLFALYRLVKRITADTGIALLTVVLTAFDYQIMTAAAFGRYDTMVAALGFGAYAVYLSLRETKLGMALFVANAMVAAAGATHPNGVFYFVGLWFLILYCDRKRLRWQTVLIAFIPYAIGGALWAAYISRDFVSFKTQLSRNSGGRIGILHPWQALMSEVQKRYIAAFGLGAHSAGHASMIVRLKAVALLAYAAGIVGCLAIPAIRKNRDYRLLFYLAGIHWFLMTFYENIKFSYYLVHLIPLYCVLLAIVVVYLWRSAVIPRWALAAATAAVMLIAVGGILAKVRLDDYHNVYLPAVAYIKQHASPQDEIFTVCSFGFGYGFEKPIIDDDSLGYYSGKRPRYIVMEEIFDDQHKLMSAADSAKYQHVQDMLNSYRLVYRNSEYRIYERPPGMLAAQDVSGQ